MQSGVNGAFSKQQEYFQSLVDKYPNDERALNLLGNYLDAVTWENRTQMQHAPF